jgi:hypothetical protein
MTLDEARQQLQAVHDDVHQQFGSELHEGRLAQFDAALSTTVMALGHLHDEQERHTHNPKAHARATGAYVPEE